MFDYTTNALNPARISKILIFDPVKKILEVIVPEDQLSLAIGRKGQNVRLASKLLGWEINIKSAEEKKKEILSQLEDLGGPSEAGPLADLKGVGEKTQSRLREAGIVSIQDLASKSVEDLAEIPRLGQKTAQQLIDQAKEWVRLKFGVGIPAGSRNRSGRGPTRRAVLCGRNP